MNEAAADSPAITTVAIAATFTAEPVEASLRFWMEELGIPAKISFAPYSQVFQQLVDPSSLLSGNRNGINVLLVRLADLAPAGVGPEDGFTPDIQTFLSAMKGAAERAGAPYLVCFCPSPPAGPDRGHEERIAGALRALPDVQAFTSGQLLSSYPVAEVFDPDADLQANVPYTPELFTALGTLVARRIYGLNNAPYKVIAVDADQTLWSGVCGEDGPDGIRIDGPRRALQEFLVEQHDAGMILCLCSKNNEEDVAAVFDRRADMILRREHFAGWRVNWKPKSENLRSLARELGLGLESFIFLDDDAVACADVEANCPQVLTFPLPASPDAIAPFLRNNWAFDHRKVTKEASDRTAFYRQNAERREFEMESLTLEDFLAGLRLKTSILSIASDDLVRAAELTQRTNQFNATTIRRSEGSLQTLFQQGSEGLVVRVRDRFGDYGLVGAMIFSATSDALRVDTFLLSCRALGRGVEHRMLAKLGEIALERGLSRVDVPYRASGKNRPALDFLESAGAGLGSREGGADGEETLFRFPADRAAATRYEPPSTSPEAARESLERPEDAAALRTPADARPKAALLSSIATELSDAGEVTALIAAQRLARPEMDVPYVAPVTETEKQLAVMFEQLLGVERVGTQDNFFSLGGHSLLTMMLINRVRSEFHVEFPIAVLFEKGFTLAKAAQTVARFQKTAPAGRAPDALNHLLETLSDDEVRALVAEQETPVPGKSSPEKA
jgi:FkbH-like protein